MGIQLEEKFNGIACDYWKIGSYSYDDANYKFRVYLWLHPSKDIRDADGEAHTRLKREVIDVNNYKVFKSGETGNSLLHDELIELLYNCITESKLNSEGVETNRFALGTRL